MDARYDAVTIAKWFIAWAEAAEDTYLSNLKVQKLLYYAQGHHLGAFRVPLFGEDVQAWAHGPVVPSVYHWLKQHGSEGISLPPDDPFDWPDVDPDTTDHLMRVWNTYGPLAAWALRNRTHSEPPWARNFTGTARSAVIPHEDMIDYFAGTGGLGGAG